MNIKEIDQIIEEGESLKTLSQAYGELASQKIKKIKAEVERNRIFFDEIASVFTVVKRVALKKKINLVKKKGIMLVVLTSNYRFYGNINTQLIKFFKLQTAKLAADRIFIGKDAINHFKAIKYPFGYQTITFEKDLPTGQELFSLVNIIKDYSQVLVFYSQLKSILVQIPIFKDITLSSITGSEGETTPQSYIFEPEILKILEFFDSEIITLLLEQTFLESELSRTASRLISMDQAQVEANSFIKEQKKLLAYLKRSINNNLILEAIAASRKVTHGF